MLNHNVQQFKSIINNFIPGDIAAVNDTVREIQNVLLTAASPCKVTSSNIGSNDKLEISPWHDGECSRSRKIYNRKGMNVMKVNPTVIR